LYFSPTGAITVLTILSFVEVSRELRGQNRRQLQQGAESIGLAIYERLTILDSELQVAALRIQQSNALPPHTDGARFQTLTVWKQQIDPKAPANYFPAITASENAHLHSGKSVIRVASCSKNPGVRCVALMKMIDPADPASDSVVGEVAPAYLWSADRLPPQIDLCVLKPRQGVLYNSDPGTVATATIPSQRGSSGSFEWKSHDAVYDAIYRDVFLEPEFHTPTWTVIQANSWMVGNPYIIG
jgi:hypothetical protein